MRIAVCFSGGFRNFRETYPIFKKNLLDLNPHYIFDFFFSSWKGYQKIPVKLNHHKLDVTPLKEILIKINPIKYSYINYTNSMMELGTTLSGLFDIREKCKCNQPKCETCGGLVFYNHIGQLLNIFLCNELKKEYEKENELIYDRVIRCRFDTKLVRKIHGKIFENINEKEILVGPHDSEFDDRLDDTFAIGLSAAMDFYSKSILNMKNTLSYVDYRDDFPHRNLYYHLNNSNFSANETDNLKSIISRKLKKIASEIDMKNIEGIY